MNKNISIDIFSETNPAFLSVMLWHFLSGIKESGVDGADFPLIFLPIPLVLYKNSNVTFDHTNKKTGILRWINTNKGILLDLTNRVNMTSDYSRRAISFGFMHSILDIDSSTGKIITSDQGFSKKPTYPASDVRGNAFTKANRLGYWIGDLNSTETTFNALGIAV